PRTGWTGLLVLAAPLLALAAVLGVVSPRPRSAVEPPGASTNPEHEPPPSPLVAPRPHGLDAPAPRPDPAREPARRAHDAGRGRRAAPASAPVPAQLVDVELHALRAGIAVPGAAIELVHEPADGASAVTLHHADESGTLHVALAPGALRAVAWADDAIALPVHT